MKQKKEKNIQLHIQLHTSMRLDTRRLCVHRRIIPRLQGQTDREGGRNSKQSPTRQVSPAHTHKKYTQHTRGNENIPFKRRKNRRSLQRTTHTPMTRPRRRQQGTQRNKSRKPENHGHDFGG
jgi:hypothetical protein